MTKLMKYKNPDGCFYMGRNGTGKCKGLEVIDWGEIFMISPINTNGNTHSNYIEIPFEEIPNLIVILQELVNPKLNNV
jgi:hypothetical protein